MSSIIRILIAPERAAPMIALDQVTALARRGLRGDRYTLAGNRKSPDYQVTLIEAESIEAYTRTTGLPISAEGLRRNLVTRGVRLNDLCGKRFSVGAAEFEGLELCEPCSFLAARTSDAALRFFVGKGGLRARICKGGIIRIGDILTAPAR